MAQGQSTGKEQMGAEINLVPKPSNSDFCGRKLEFGVLHMFAQTESDERYCSSTFRWPLEAGQIFKLRASVDANFRLPKCCIHEEADIHVVETNGELKVELVNCSKNENAIVRVNIVKLKPSQRVPVLSGSPITFGTVQCRFTIVKDPVQATWDLICVVCEQLTGLRSNHVSLMTNDRKPVCKECLAKLKQADQGKECPTNSELLSLDRVPVARLSMSEMKKLLTLLTSSSPTCADCPVEGGWPMHGSDYIECQTCAKILCPQCSLKKHRDHKLRGILAAKQKSKLAMREAEEKLITSLVAVNETKKGLSCQLEDGRAEFNKAKTKVTANEEKIRQFINNFDNGKTLEENKTLVSEFINDVNNVEKIQRQWQKIWEQKCAVVDLLIQTTGRASKQAIK